MPPEDEYDPSSECLEEYEKLFDEKEKLKDAICWLAGALSESQDAYLKAISKLPSIRSMHQQRLLAKLAKHATKSLSLELMQKVLLEQEKKVKEES